MGGLVSGDVPDFLMSTVNEADAKKAYSALMEFKDVVKANPISPTTPSTPAGLTGKLGAIDAAAGKLSSAAYPLIKDVDWQSSLSLTPLPGASPSQVLDVYNAFGKIVNPIVPNYLFSSVNPADA